MIIFNQDRNLMVEIILDKALFFMLLIIRNKSCLSVSPIVMFFYPEVL
jgi:hypothetical protein